MLLYICGSKSSEVLCCLTDLAANVLKFVLLYIFGCKSSEVLCCLTDLAANVLKFVLLDIFGCKSSEVLCCLTDLAANVLKFVLLDRYGCKCSFIVAVKRSQCFCRDNCCGCCRFCVQQQKLSLHLRTARTHERSMSRIAVWASSDKFLYMRQSGL